jgi:hypothetical protein
MDFCLECPLRHWLAFALFLSASAAFAADVRVTVLPGEEAAECASKGQLIAVPATGTGRVAVPLRKDASSYTLHLPSAGHWDVHVVSAGCWSESRPWMDGAGQIELRVYKASTVEMPLSPRPPAKLFGTVSLQRGGWSAEAVSNDAERCPIENGKARCAVPGDILFDLRLDAPGYASSYFWDQKVRGGVAAKLPVAALEPGASIAGWVHDPKDKPIRDSIISCFSMDLLANVRDHVPARIQTVRSNSRGFFQCTGLREGRYRVVFESPGLSPAAVSDVSLHSGESLVLPKAVRHSPAGAVSIALDPPLDRQGHAWTVVLTEASGLYPSRERKVITRAASVRGQWTANGLRADTYDVEIRNAAGALVERTTVDLFGGGPHALLLNVRSIVLRGAVRAGDQPLQADVILSDSAGAYLQVSADKDGNFETPLPSPGEWRVTVLYPPLRSPAHIKAPPLHIPDDASESPQDVVIRIPGGRIHGKVVGKNGESGKAAVHARQGRSVPAQQMADANGEFDLIGLSAGAYMLDAQNIAGSTPAPVSVELAQDETREVTLVTERMLTLSGEVVTPSGQPASGAVVRLSSGDGSGWQSRIADVQGRFKYDLSRATRAVQIVVVTYDYPAAFVSVPVREDDVNEQMVQLSRDGGVLRVPHPMDAYVTARGVVAPFGILRYSQYYSRADGGVYVESGTYTVCERGADTPACRTINVMPGTEHDWKADPRPRDTQ